MNAVPMSRVEGVALSESLRRIPLDDITLDPELQPREVIDRALLEDYGAMLVDGGTLPPVVAFENDETLLLADGYHRWHAHKMIMAPDILVDVRQGRFDEALRHSLAANATHGKRREKGDYVRAYDIACAHNLVAAENADAVQAVLQCSHRWAEALTQPAREARRQKRDAAIREAATEGKSVREIADATGVSKSAVGRALTVPPAHSAEMGQPTNTCFNLKSDDPAADPSQQPAVSPETLPLASSPPPADTAEQAERMRASLADLESPPIQRWAAVIRALRVVAELPTVDDLFQERRTDFDYLINPALTPALEWLMELQRRMNSGQ